MKQKINAKKQRGLYSFSCYLWPKTTVNQTSKTFPIPDNCFATFNTVTVLCFDFQDTINKFSQIRNIFFFLSFVTTIFIEIRHTELQKKLKESGKRYNANAKLRDISEHIHEGLCVQQDLCILKQWTAKLNMVSTNT